MGKIDGRVSRECRERNDVRQVLMGQFIAWHGEDSESIVGQQPMATDRVAIHILVQ